MLPLLLILSTIASANPTSYDIPQIKTVKNLNDENVSITITKYEKGFYKSILSISENNERKFSCYYFTKNNFLKFSEIISELSIAIEKKQELKWGYALKGINSSLRGSQSENYCNFRIISIYNPENDETFGFLYFIHNKECFVSMECITDNVILVLNKAKADEVARLFLWGSIGF